MPNTLIFGGSGKVARHLTRLLVKNEGHTVYSVIRNPDQKESLAALGANPIVQSIETSTTTDLTLLIQSVSPTTVVWAAGAGGGDPERTKAVDNEGAIRSMDATAAAGVRRYIIVSALDVRDRSLAVPEWYDDADRQRSDRVWSAIGPYMAAKLAADRSLVSENERRKLDYTIVRPGGLSEEPGVGTVSAGKIHLSPTIPREDVAAFVSSVSSKWERRVWRSILWAVKRRSRMPWLQSPRIGRILSPADSKRLEPMWRLP